MLTATPRRPLVFTICDGVVVLLTIVLAYGLKHHYSTATAEELGWMLRPTAVMVGALTGSPFAAETHTGFVSKELRFILGPSCAGVNFFIVAFCTAIFGLVRSVRTVRGKLFLFLGSLASAYAVTLLVNTVRILAGIALHVHDVSFGWLDTERIHRIEGIFVYVLFLCASYTIARRFLLRATGCRP